MGGGVGNWGILNEAGRSTANQPVLADWADWAD